MGWVQVATGAYYLVGTALLLKKFTDTEDVARGGTRIDKDNVGKLGLVGAKAGLILDQNVDGSSWTTKVPIEYHFRRKPIPEEFLEDWDTYVGWLEETESPLVKHPKVIDKLRELVGGRLPKSVEFYVQTEWWDNSFTPEKFPSTANHRFFLDNSFAENTMAEYEKLNSPGASVKRTVHGDEKGLFEVPISTQGGPPKTSGGQEKEWQQDRSEPMTYGIIQPKNMGGGIPIISYLDDVQLSFKSTMVPRVETTSLADLLLFFGWNDPAAVNHKIDASGQQQQIDYDLY